MCCILYIHIYIYMYARLSWSAMQGRCWADSRWPSCELHGPRFHRLPRNAAWIGQQSGMRLSARLMAYAISYVRLSRAFERVCMHHGVSNTMVLWKLPHELVGIIIFQARQRFISPAGYACTCKEGSCTARVLRCPAPSLPLTQ